MAYLRYELFSNGKNQEYELELTADEISIGRDNDNIIVLEDEQVSRHHALIMTAPRGFLLVDNKSANGTYLGSQKVQHHFLKHGDSFSVGSTFFQFYESIQSPEPSLHPPQQTITPLLQQKGTQPKQRSRSWMTALIILLIVLIIGGIIGTYLLRDSQFLNSLKNRFSASSEVATIAPELAHYGSMMHLYSRPTTTMFSTEGGEMKFDDGALFKIPSGALDQSVEFTTAIIELALNQKSADVYNAKIYMISASVDRENLSRPITLEFPVSTYLYSIAILENGTWQTRETAGILNPHIELTHFSRQYVAFIQWDLTPDKSSAQSTSSSDSFALQSSDRSETTDVPPESGSISPIPVPANEILAPNDSEITLGYLSRFLKWFENRDFSSETSLGNLSSFTTGMNTKLTVTIDPAFSMGGKYYSYRARFFGGAGPIQIRNNLLVVKTLSDDFLQLKTLWHEFLHHMINIKGGSECGQEETYMELCENRVDWLASLGKFDEYINSLNAFDPRACAELQRRWNGIAGRWENFNGNNLSGPFSWQDPGGATCGENDKTYTISPAYITSMDRLLGIDIDFSKIRTLYQQKARALASSGGMNDCALKDINPAPMPPPPSGTSSVDQSQPALHIPESSPQQPVCPPKVQVVQKCPYSPDGYQVLPCSEGFCFDTGPRGSYVCVQTEVPANGKRTYTGPVECLPGFTADIDPCTGVLKACK